MPAFAGGMSLLDTFLTEIVDSIRSKNGQRLTDLIQLDFESLSAESQKSYSELNRELQKYPPGHDGALVARCRKPLSYDEFGPFSNSFPECIIQYFRYLRDSTADNQTKATKIRQLTSQCVIALGDRDYGIIMIPIVLSFSRVLAVVATNLDRNPALLRGDNLPTLQDAEGGEGKFSFVEDAANVLREAFIKCLSGSPGVPRTSRPAKDDKRIGIYLTANSALKLFLRSRRLRSAQQIFNSINAQSPPLSYYPAAQRVTYLYFLGRYHIANNHFLRAQKVLQAAYDQCHRQAINHRRSILIYLVAANLCLGRSPSSSLLLRPEAIDIGAHFTPLCQIIRTGDLGMFYQYLDLSSESAEWFLKRSILFQLQNRSEILVWRNLVRKTFVLIGYKGEEKKVPFLRLNQVQHAARWSLQRQKPVRSRFGAAQAAEQRNVDPEFAGMEEAVQDTGLDIEGDEFLAEKYGQQGSSKEATEEPPTMHEVESVVLSLIQQGLLKGYALHTNPRLAIPSRGTGPLTAGFPDVWSVISVKDAGDPVPGLVTEEDVGDIK